MWRLLKEQKYCKEEVRLYTLYSLQTLLPPTWYRNTKWVTMMEYSQGWYALEQARLVNAYIEFKLTREDKKKPSWYKKKR